MNIQYTLNITKSNAIVIWMW